MDNITLILQTCDAYKPFWKLWHKCFNRHWNFEKTKNWKFRFCIERDSEAASRSGIDNMDIFSTGHGEFSERLYTILKNTKTEYVFYMQEDFWIRRFPPLDKYLELMINNKLDCLKVKSVLHWHSLSEPDNDGMMKYLPNSEYIFSHDTAFWKTSSLMKMVMAGPETPWKNEIDGTKRIRSMNMNIRVILEKEWYLESVKSGVILDEGLNLLKEQL